MTRKTTGKQSTSAPEIVWGGFIDIRLTEGEEKDFWLWYQTETANILPTVFELVSLGYKFGLSYDPDSDAYLATFTAYGESLIGLANRYCMTARAPQADAAIGLLVYKHVIIADGKWGNYMPRTGKMRNFG